MEFYFENDQWNRRDSKDGKYWVITKQKTVVEISNFRYRPEGNCPDTVFKYEHGLIPTCNVTIHRSGIHYFNFCCSLLTGKWAECNPSECTTFISTMDMLNKMDDETIERRVHVRNTIEILPKELRLIVCEYICK